MMLAEYLKLAWSFVCKWWWVFLSAVLFILFKYAMYQRVEKLKAQKEQARAEAGKSAAVQRVVLESGTVIAVAKSELDLTKSRLDIEKVYAPKLAALDVARTELPKPYEPVAVTVGAWNKYLDKAAAVAIERGAK